MSRLEDITAKLCSDGVEFKPLGEICVKTENIAWDVERKRELEYIDLTSVNRNTHVIEKTELINAHNAPSRAQKIICAEDVIFGTTRPTLKRYCFIPEKYNNQICSTGYCVLRADRRIVLPRFIFHYMGTARFFAYVEANQKGSAYPAISDSDVRNFTLPIPPLPIQQEIVRILDTFTALEAELEAELEKRKAQYEYYREQLLAFNNEIVHKYVGELCGVSRGRVMSKEYLRENTGPYPVYSSQTASDGVFGFINSFDYDCESITWITDGANAGSVFYHIDEKFSITNVCGLLRVRTPAIITRYLFYYLKSTSKAYVSSGMGNPKLMNHAISKIKIPIPPIAEQARIVSILDRFDALVNDITQGLPAEIAARRKQYEYYRDKLLTFKRKEAAV